jgi:hypothetical protein
MSTEVKHFLITPEGGIREFTTEQAALVAAGTRPLPEFAKAQLRYLQLTLDDSEAGEIKVQTSGAFVAFDDEGRVVEAKPPKGKQTISRFEHDAVVQWALKDIPAVAPTFH